MNKIDDNTMAAYLEGSLNDEERERVERIIEGDDELKAVVDEWISMADDLYAKTNQKTADGRELRMEACRSIVAVMKQMKRESEIHEVAACAANTERAAVNKSRWPLYRKIIVAASIMAIVSAMGIWLFRSPEDGIRSAPSFVVPIGGDYMSFEPDDTAIIDTSMQRMSLNQCH